jgi:sugar phosphate isomerase/epimerase
MEIRIVGGTMKIGIRGHDLKADTPEKLAKTAKAHGFSHIQLVLKKSFGIDIHDLDEEKISKMMEPFRKNDIEIALLGAYFNPVHSDPEYRKTNIAGFKKHLEMARQFGTPYVGTETGSYMDSPWTYHPRNHLEESYLEVREVVRELVGFAEGVGACVLIEGAYNHLIYKPELLRRLLDDIPSDNFWVIVDLYNYLNIENYQNHREILDRALALLKDKISVIHLKDFIVQDGKLKQVGLGSGLMDYPYIMKQIKAHVPDAVLIFEGITGNDIPTSREFIRRLEDKA